MPPENYFLEEHRILARVVRLVLAKNLPPQGPILFDELLLHYPEPRVLELMAYYSSLGNGVPIVSPNWFYAGWINRLAVLRRLATLREAQHDAEGPRAQELQTLIDRELRSLPPEPPREWPK